MRKKKRIVGMWTREPVSNGVILTQHLGLVGMVVKTMTRNWKERELVESEALCGLLYAVRYWNAERGFKFSTYAVACITGAVSSWRDREKRFRVRAYKKFSRTLCLFSELGGYFVGGNTNIFASEVFDPVDAAMLTEKRAAIRLAQSTLTYREREILNLRYGLFEGDCYTLDEVARAFQITRERVRQIEAKAVRKMGDKVRSKILESFAPEAPDHPPRQGAMA